MNFLKTFFYLAFTSIIFTSEVSANEPGSMFFTTQWESKCQESSTSKEKICVLEKYIFEDKNQKKRIGGIVIRRSNQNQNVLITIISPLGLALSPGVEIQIGKEKASTQPFIFCDGGGCVSQFIGDDKLIPLLIQSKDISLTYQLLNGRKIMINVGLENFRSLYEDMRRKTN
jgi:invasion protein IalB